MPYDHDDEDPKKPHAVPPPHKGDGDLESEEYEPREVGPRRSGRHDRRFARC